MKDPRRRGGGPYSRQARPLPRNTDVPLAVPVVPVPVVPAVPPVVPVPLLPAVPAEPAELELPLQEPVVLCRTRRLFCTWRTPETASARSSAWRLAKRLSTVPLRVTSLPETLTSMSEASICGSSVRRSLTSSRMRSSERE